MTPEVGDGISKSRLERLTDGVFAIVMTVLVLEITIPHLSPTEISVELPKQIINLIPMILSYMTSFIILGFFWIGHDDQFPYIRRVNRTLLGISIFYLMFIALIPFSTTLIGEYGNQQISVLIYGMNLIICSLWNYVHWWYATKNHRLIERDLDSYFIKIESIRYLINICMYIFAILISFININISTLLYIATPIYYLMPLQKNKYLFWSRK